MVQVSLQEDSEKLAMPELTLFGTSSLIFSSETETKLFTFQLFWSLITDMPWTIKLCSEHVKEFWVKVSRDFWKNLEFKTMEPLWLLVWNKSSLLFQKKLMSRELISDQQEEPWSDNSHPSINSSLTIIMARFLMRSKISWRKSRMNFWSSVFQSKPDTTKSQSINSNSAHCS